MPFPCRRGLKRRQLVLLIGGALAAAPAPGQTVTAPTTPGRDWTFRPVFTLGAGYNTNVAYTREGALEDYFGSVGLRAPLQGRLGRNASLTASYSLNGEWYRERSAFDAFPSRQEASLAFTHAPGRWNLGLNGGYSESRRPEDVFPEAGVGYLRGKTRNAIAGASLGRQLGQRTRFETGYTYNRPFYEALDIGDRLSTEATSHTAQASLTRQFSKTTSLAARYTYQQYLREDFADDTSHVVGLGYKTGLGRRVSLDLFGGARLQGSDARPDWSATLHWTGRSSGLSLGYSRSRNYVPTTEGFTDTESAYLTWQYQRGRFQASLTGGYAQNDLEQEVQATRSQDFESWRGAFRTAYMLTRWLGLAGVYDYHWQRSQDERFGDRSRHLVQAGLTVTPWGDRKPQGLN